MGVVKAGRVELVELHIGDPAASAPGHGYAVAGRAVRITGIEVDFAGAAGGKNDKARLEDFNTRPLPRLST